MSLATSVLDVFEVFTMMVSPPCARHSADELHRVVALIALAKKAGR